MLRSNFCNTVLNPRNNKNDCEFDPGGYFIVKGNEYSVVHVDRLRTDYPVIRLAKNVKTHLYNSKIELTHSNIRGTTKLEFYFQDMKTSESNQSGQNRQKHSIFEVKFGSQGGYIYANPIIIMYYLYVNYFNKSSSDDEAYQEFRNLLQANMNTMLGIDGQIPEIDELKLLNIHATLENFERILQTYAKDAATQNQDVLEYYIRKNNILGSGHNPFSGVESEQTFDFINKYLLPGVSIMEKITTLIYIMSQLSLYKSGFRDLDNLNIYDLKILETAGRTMEKHLTENMGHFKMTGYADWKKEISTMNVGNNMNISNLQNIVTNSFRSGFLDGAWKTKSNKQDDNDQEKGFSQLVTNDNLLSRISIIRKVVRPSSKRSTDDAVRQVNSSHYGIVDIADTPDDESCGFKLQKAISCRSSLNRNEGMIKGIIDEYLDDETAHSLPSAENNIPCIINGVFYAWTNIRIYQVLIAMRRKGIIYADVGIGFRNNSIVIQTTGSRPYRPLFTVNQRTGRLIYRELFERGVVDEYATVNSLRELGAIEYCDKMEEVSYLIAQTEQEVEDKKKHIEKSGEKVTDHTNVPEGIEIRSESDIWNEIEGKRNLYIENLRSGLRREPTEDEIYEVMEDEFLARYSSQVIDTDVEKVHSPKDELRYFTHCEISPTVMFGLSGTTIPFPEHLHGPRLVYQCKMNKQALGIYHSNYPSRVVNEGFIQLGPRKPILGTPMGEMVGLSQLPHGETATVAIGTGGGFAQEDSIIFNKKSIDMGKFRSAVTHTFETFTSSSTNNNTTKNNTDPDFWITNPLNYGSIRSQLNPKRYSHLDEYGLPRIGSLINPGDIVIGMVGKQKGVDIDSSVTTNTNQKGRVKNIIINDEAGKTDIDQKLIQGTVKVLLEDIRTPMIGNKFNNRYAQKSTIGEVRDEEDMPFTADGRTPDMYFNPNSFPSRMTNGLIMEMIASKVASLLGESRLDASYNAPFNERTLKRRLRELGFRSNGTEILHSGKTGNLIRSPYSQSSEKKFIFDYSTNSWKEDKISSSNYAEVFMGPIYYNILKHFVEDKIQARGVKGEVNPESRGPERSRKKGGGIRLGEMERDALISHGSAEVTQERMLTSSDAVRTLKCIRCGSLVQIRNILRTNTDNHCPTCGTEYYEDIGRVTIPFSFIKTISYLQAVGVKTSLHENDTLR